MAQNNKGQLGWASRQGAVNAKLKASWSGFYTSLNGTNQTGNFMDNVNEF